MCLLCCDVLVVVVDVFVVMWFVVFDWGCIVGGFDLYVIDVVVLL